MNYINEDKNYMTDEERIKYLEESIRELRKEKENLKKEKGEIRQRLLKLEKEQAELSRVKENKELEEENKKLKEKLEVLEKAKFEVMAYIDMCYPKTYMEAEKLQKMKEMFERIYNEKLYFLEKENQRLKSDLNLVIDERDNAFKKVEQLREKIEELEIDYDRLKVAFEDVVSGK